VYYSVVGLKICTIHCSVISVETLFSHHFTPCRHFWSVIFTSCIFSQPASLTASIINRLYVTINQSINPSIFISGVSPYQRVPNSPYTQNSAFLPWQ